MTQELRYAGYPSDRRRNEALVLNRWLEEVRYKPGSRLRVVYDERLDVNVLRLSHWVMDSTRFEQVHVLPMTSIRVHIKDRPEELSGIIGGPLVEVCSRAMVPPYLPGSAEQRLDPDFREQRKHDFRRWLRFELHRLEAHEADEWLQEVSTGKPVFDPHANDWGEEPDHD